MTTPLMELPTEREPKQHLERRALEMMDTTNTAPEPVREFAVERLARLLELETEAGDDDVEPITYHTGELHQLARLRMARSSYALNKTGDLRRVSRGAWLRRRYC